MHVTSKMDCSCTLDASSSKQFWLASIECLILRVSSEGMRDCFFETHGNNSPAVFMMEEVSSKINSLIVSLAFHQIPSEHIIKFYS